MTTAALGAHGEPVVSVILSTYNRGTLLGDAIRSVLDQTEPDTPPFELIVVDNNSTDDTQTIVLERAAADSRLRYVLERAQGLSHARNAGIAAARGSILTFTDDDVRVPSDWVSAVARAMAEYPDADFVGGPVLPDWPTAPPAWLTRDHWAPLALVDYGTEPQRISADRPLCLIGANFAFRRQVFERVGLFGTDFQRVKDGIGSLEDHEFLLRLFRENRHGMYDPRIRIHAEVQPSRLDRSYHRRWHAGHGRYFALMRAEDMERSSFGTLYGVPAHLYRQALADVIGWIGARVRRQDARAFHHELRLRFFGGFFRERRREFIGKGGHAAAELARLGRRRVRGHAHTTADRPVTGPRPGPLSKEGRW